MRRSLYLAAGVSAAMVAVTATVPADATEDRATPHAKAAAFKVVADNLHNPRQLVFAHGDLYIAEAGQGGNGTCIPGGEGPQCFGKTGSVTRVRDGVQKRVLKGLASLGGEGTGESALGASDLMVIGKHRLVLSMGLGSNPKNRKDLPKLGRKQLGHLLSFNLHTKKFSSLGDLAAHEAKANPVDNRDSDPTGLVKAGKRGFLVTDSGGNTLVRVKGGKVKGVAAFQDRMGVSPVTGPDPVKYQIVPTDVVKGPDGAYYVSELTGFPFIEGAARIWRIVPGHKPHVWAKGLTNVTSLAFDGKKLYAVQISDQGLVVGGPTGSLVRVFSKKSGKAAQPIATGLFAPYGVAIRGDNAFVSVRAVAPTGGQVLKIPLVP
jgi:hypothetical protein